MDETLAASKGGAAGQRTRPMKVVVHDFAGHAFQVELSRGLAARGYDVLHLHCESDIKGKGRLDISARDPEHFQVEGVRLGRPFKKYSVFSRARYEVGYARAVAAVVRDVDADVVMSGNTPLLSQWLLGRSVKRPRAFVYWQQDVWSVGAQLLLARRWWMPSRLVGAALGWMEGATLRRSSAVVPISEDFVPQLERWSVPRERVSVIENWAPLAELPQRSHDNDWSRRHGLDRTRNLVYSGTLGKKHDPALVRDLALAAADRPDVRVVVVSQGLGAAWLTEQIRERGINNLIVLPYQPYSDLPDVFASADVLLAILARDAGEYSVPSKVLSYHCAGRAILGAIPKQNLAARIIERAQSGLVVDPGDPTAFVKGALALLDDPEAARRHGAAARAYAERTFDIGRIADEFAHVLDAAASTAGGRVPVGPIGWSAIRSNESGG